MFPLEKLGKVYRGALYYFYCKWIYSDLKIKKLIIKFVASVILPDLLDEIQ